MKSLNRRDFIKGAAMLSGAAICGAAVKPAMAAEEAQAAQPQAPASIPVLPWGYQELDPEYVRKLGHMGFYLEECGGGAFWAIITALKEKVGYPYTLIPMASKEDFIAELEKEKEDKEKGVDVEKELKKKGPRFQVPMQYGAGGGVGYGSLCGAPNGSASAITYILPMKEAEEVIKRLFRYYETEAFPTDKANEYAEKHEFLEPALKSDKALAKSESDSVLCHVSVGRWCERSGYASGSKERSERCARVTGDVAAMAVTLLNAQMKGQLNTAFPMHLSHDTAGCKTCHAKGENYETGQFTRGSMDCKPCHDEAMVPHKGANVLKTAYGADVSTWAGAAVIGTVAGIGVHAVSKRVSKGQKDDEE